MHFFSTLRQTVTRYSNSMQIYAKLICHVCIRGNKRGWNSLARIYTTFRGKGFFLSFASKSLLAILLSLADVTDCSILHFSAIWSPNNESKLIRRSCDSAVPEVLGSESRSLSLGSISPEKFRRCSRSLPPFFFSFPPFLRRPPPDRGCCCCCPHLRVLLSQGKGLAGSPAIYSTSVCSSSPSSRIRRSRWFVAWCWLLLFSLTHLSYPCFLFTK